ncbi:hypothetical protein NZD89_08710 [Alicyclobacillus fastidiosus]|uniref:Spore coat protein D n=1 Tax=Alicyclobacillus fastidiosus TaxID=392011 RepID=A0ABY6ZLU1_9BACL|nr:hypothetical protein [Alicyclobacillus fastidiosus]WAH43447.1 hypothetical protein NZD89_08710 [Alicyclobacillus fastidiosus]GMA59599.1 hypothetical protein GCM10025859_00390 [Alicyclobacillus fastidiosus]GMA65527.1 hypothetical protein GCM10025859_59670 [Alicyclobacillus fastidiosus]
MTELPGGHKYPYGKSYVPHKYSHEYESPSTPEPEESDWEHYDVESQSVSVQPKMSYVQYGTSMHKSVKKSKKMKKAYHPAYMVSHPAPHAMLHKCAPIVCDPQYVVRNCYVPREVPVIHPIVNVQRHVIVNVPRHYYQPMTKHEVVDPGCPGGHTHGPDCGC